MKKDSNFNIFNEKENKIEYCFSKLLYYAEYIKIHPKYKYINNEIFIILTDIKKWLKTYIKYKSLIKINHLKLKKVKHNIIIFPEDVSEEKYVEITEFNYWILNLIILREY